MPGEELASIRAYAPAENRLALTVRGEIQDDGQFDIVSETAPVVGDEWSDYLEGSKDLISDWRKPLSCGNFNVATGKCGGNS